MVDGVIVLYEQNETNFTSNGLGYLSDVIECTVSEELNGEYELEMEYPVDGIRYSEIQHRRILYVKPNPYEDPQPFRIYNINRPIDGRVEINARHISYDLSGYTVSESEDKNIPFSTSPKMFCEKIPSAMTELNSGMPQFTFWTNSIEEYDSETYTEEGDGLKEKHWIFIDTPSSVRSLIGQFTEKYKGEFKFDKYAVKFYGPISGQSEDDKHYRGIDSGVVLRYGKNLTDLMQEEDSDKGMYTHLYPYWSGTVNVTKTETDSESDESSSSTTTTYSSRSEEKVVTMTNKLYPILDHDVGYKRVLIYEVNSDWSEKHPNNTNDATPWPSEEDFEELCKEYIKNNELGAPKITLTASFVQLSRSAEYEDLKPLEKVLLGDTVSVLWEDLGVNSTLKCTKTEYDALTDSYKSITLGNDANASISSTVAATSSGLSGVTSSMSDKVSKEEFYNQTYDTALSTTSTNAVQNKVVTGKFNEMKRCCNEVKGEIEYLKEFVSHAGGTLSYGTDIPTGGEDGDGYVQVAQGGGSNPVTLTVGNNTGNWAINNFTPSGKKYSFTVAGTGNPQQDIANINATNLIPDHEYRVVFTAKMSSNATYYNHPSFAFGTNVAEYDSLITISHDNITRGTYDSTRRYQSFYEDNATHDYSFTFRTGANEDKVSLSFSFHDVQDDNPVTLTVTNFAVSSTSGGDNEIVDLWFKIDGEWLKYQVDNESVFTYGTADPDSNTEGDIYAKIRNGQGYKKLNLSDAHLSSSYPSSFMPTYNGEIINLYSPSSPPGYYPNGIATWGPFDFSKISSVKVTYKYHSVGTWELYGGLGTVGEAHNNETGSQQTVAENVFNICSIAAADARQTGVEYVAEFDVSSYDQNCYFSLDADAGTNVDIYSVSIYKSTEIYSIDDIFYKIDDEWKTETDSGGSTVSVTPIQTTGTHIADIEVDGVIAELYAPTGGGGGSATTELLYSGNSLSNSIQLSKPWTDFDALYILGGANESGSVFEFASMLFKDDLATDYRIGVTTDIGYIWYSITNNTTLSLMGAYTGYYIKAIRGIKFSGGGGGGSGDIPAGGTTGQVLGKLSDTDQDVGWINQSGGSGGGIINDILYSASSSIPPSTISLAHPYTDYDYIVINAFGPYSNELVYAFGNVYPTGDLEIGLEIGATNNDYWCWYTVTDSQTLTVSAVHSDPTFYIKSIRGIKLSGGGSGGGVTRETIWTGNAYTGSGYNTTNKPITDYDLLLCYHYDYPGVTTDEEAHLFWLDPKRIADNNYAVNYYDGNFEFSYYDSIYIRGKFTNATTFIIGSDYGGGRLFRIDGIKFSGGSGGGGQRTETPILASPITTTGTYQVTDYSDADELIFEIGVYAGGATQVFTTVVLASTLRKGWDMFVGGQYYTGSAWAANASIRYVDDTHIQVVSITGSTWAETATIFSITKVCY